MTYSDLEPSHPIKFSMSLVYRRLGATERAVWLRDRATPLHFALTAQIQGAIATAQLPTALECLQQRHPLLRAKIAVAPEGTAYFVEQAAPIPCRIVPRHGERHWQSEAAWELTQPFDWTVAPLIRVVCLHSAGLSELILVCHHAIADGMATVNLIREILSFLEHPDLEGLNRVVPSPLESLLPDYQPAPILQKALASGLLQLQRWSQSIYPKPNSTSRVNSPIQVDARALSPEITAQLIHRCRQESTTVHAAISTAWMFAIALNSSSPQQTLRCFTPINLRPYLLGKLEQECGIYIAPAQTSHPITPQTSFWPMARSLKSQLRVQVARNHLIKLAQQHEVLMSINPNPELVQQLFSQNFTSDVMVTNLGRIAIPQHYGRLVLKSLYGPMVLSGFALERVCGVATLGDRLFFTIIHDGSKVEAKLADQAIEVLKTAIQNPALTQYSAPEMLVENRRMEVQKV